MRLLLLLIAARAARLRRDRLLVAYQRERRGVTYRTLADACGEANAAALALCEESRRARALRSIVKMADEMEAA